MKNALLIFIKNPEKGKVKTRLAESVGDSMALQLYLRLLEKTRQVSSSVAAHRFLYYSSSIEENDSWDKNRFNKRVQEGEDLGERMNNAFVEAFGEGYEKVCIIGSDCYQLDAGIIQKSFEVLDSHDLVIGPANDGGYYLLGMKKHHPSFFLNKEWSTEHVYGEALKEASKLKLSVYRLSELIDVDYKEDALKSGLLS